MTLRALLIPLSLLAAGTVAGRFIWPRQRGIPAEEMARVNAAWSAAARETGLTESALTQRPAHPVLACRRATSVSDLERKGARLNLPP